MIMQTEPTSRIADPLLGLGLGEDEVSRALLLLGADGADPALVAERVSILVRLCRACGSLQSAKLAYSLAQRAAVPLTDESGVLLAEAVRCSECVPAGVRLWKKALEAGLNDALYLGTAACLGEDGAEQIKALHLLKESPELLPAVAPLARRLKAPGWEADGSWGATLDPEHGLVWWDHAAPEKRKAYGMMLTTGPVSLKNRLGAKFLFEARHEILGTTDRCHLEVSSDGTRWDKVLKFEGSADWSSYVVDLSKYGDRSLFLRFHVLSGGHREGRGVEIAGPRIESFFASHQESLCFEEWPEGWRTAPASDSYGLCFVGAEAELPLCSETFELGQLKAPTLSCQARVRASSVYAEGILEVLDSEVVVFGRRATQTPDWESLHIPLEGLSEETLSVRLWSRFSKRRDEDGFWLRDVRLRGGSTETHEVLMLDGGVEDGSREQRMLLELLESGDRAQLERLSRLREGLPSLKSALALADLLDDESHIPALLLLFGRIKEEAGPAFRMLTEAASGEDLHLQAAVLLQSGLERYLSTRDHLGDGLLPADEFADNSRLYLRLRREWTEEQARQGLSLLLTPVGAESAGERRELVESLYARHPQAEAFFNAWREYWAAS